MHFERQRGNAATRPIAISTPKCRICGGGIAPGAEPVEVDGGTVTLCEACAALVDSKRLDIAIGEPPVPKHSALTPEGWYGAATVWASWDGGTWKRVRYSEAIGRAETRKAKRAKPKGFIEIGTGNKNGKPVTVDGVRYSSITAAAQALGMGKTTLAHHIERGNGRAVVKGRTVERAER